MATATLPLIWRGRSGREYVPMDRTRLRHGGMATVRKVVGRGGRVGTSTIDDGVPLALKLWHEGDETSLDQLQHEARILVEISSHGGQIPAPRLYDLIGNPLVTGLVMEWCPVDLERWWREKLDEPDAFGRLVATMAEAARRVADYHEMYATRAGLQPAHGDLKPSNILMSMEGRWLISDFGTAQVPMPEDDEWAESRVIVATENFISPEVMFQAKKDHPAAMDAWSLGATTFALLRMRRMVLDGTKIPRNGTHSPRFRMDRMNQVIEIFARDPTRFVDRDLEPSDFPDPLRLPEEDRRTLRDLLEGTFGEKGDKREDQLFEQLVTLLDRCMSVDPAHRYTNCRDLAAAFDELTRTYIGLSATAADLPPPPTPDIHEIIRSRDEALRRNRAVQDELAKANNRLAEMSERLLALAEEETMSLPPPEALQLDDTTIERLVDAIQPATHIAEAPEPWAPPVWWGIVFVVMVVLQAATLLLAVVSLVLSLT